MHDVDLTIVLIVRDPDDSPTHVVAALAGQAMSKSTEIIVVDGRESPAAGTRLPPNLRSNVILAPGENMPRLKAIGLESASGNHVAFLEPNGIPQDGWLSAVQAATREDPYSCYGGPVVFGSEETAINLAAYSFEYRDFSLEQIQQNPVSILPGNNMVIPRVLLQSLCEEILRTEGLNKPFCQQRLIENSVGIALRLDMIVTLKKEHRILKFLRRRFDYGRCFGGTRLRLVPQHKRFFYRIAAPSIPLILLVKHIFGLSKRDLRRLDVKSFAVLSIICIVWGVGEALGYWFGRCKSCDQLY